MKKQPLGGYGKSFPDMDIDSRPGKQPGSEGKQKDTEEEMLGPTALPKGNPQQGPRSRSDLTGLRMFEEAKPKQENCRPKPKPRSSAQQQSTQQAQQSSQQQGQTFDNMPKQQVQQMGQQGGTAERKKSPPICP